MSEKLTKERFLESIAGPDAREWAEIARQAARETLRNAQNRDTREEATLILTYANEFLGQKRGKP